MDGETIAWWLKQSDAALQDLVAETGTVDLIAGLHAIQRFLMQQSEREDLRDVYVWGNSNLFDLGILQHLFDKYDMQVPWHYARDMNVRTIVWMAKTFFGIDRPGMADGTEHNALDDARHQAEYVEMMVKAILAGGKPDGSDQ